MAAPQSTLNPDCGSASWEPAGQRLGGGCRLGRTAWWLRREGTVWTAPLGCSSPLLPEL